MNEKYSDFQKSSDKVAFDKEHREKIKFNIGRYDQAVFKGKQRYANLDLARQRAAGIKHKSLAQLDKLLVEFETNFIRNGGKVIWACDADDALKEIVKLLESRKIKKVVKSKSMTTEEIELNHHLEKSKIAPIETDLGEYIVQIAGEKPYHIVTPAMHKSKGDVAKLYNEKFGLNPNSTPEEITAFTRLHLRNHFISAGAGITGANFILADIGGISVTENEGNGLMSMAFPTLHIVIVGIEKIIPSVDDLDLFLPLLATHGTGQAMTVYNSIVTGPTKNGIGPSEMVVVLLDNGRTELLAKARQREALGCIRCGACLNVCPVYKNIGGYTYDATYTGPIGSVIMQHLKPVREYSHLSFASSLCGSCTEACPVKIPLHELLLLNRSETVEAELTTSSDRFLMKNATKILNNRRWLDFFGGGNKNRFLRHFVAKHWGKRRNLPVIAPKSFSQLWMEQETKK
jgi:L-lactate dehydrogenase complex protein LldF